MRNPLMWMVIFQVYFSALRGLPEGLCMRDWLGQGSWCLTRVFPISSPVATESSFATQTVKHLTLWHLMALFSNIKLCWDLLGNHTDAHPGDNGITSSVSRVIALDSDERGMSRNTFSFPLRGKLQGRGSSLESTVCVRGRGDCRVGWREGEKKDDDVIG